MSSDKGHRGTIGRDQEALSNHEKAIDRNKLACKHARDEAMRSGKGKKCAWLAQVL